MQYLTADILQFSENKLDIKVQNNAFRNISNLRLRRNSVSLNINFKSK